jgi:hypothetical protein
VACHAGGRRSSPVAPVDLQWPRSVIQERRGGGFNFEGDAGAVSTVWARSASVRVGSGPTRRSSDDPREPAVLVDDRAEVPVGERVVVDVER